MPHSSNIPPVWLMRQAGRYLPEYQALRKKQPDFLKFCLDENLVVEATLQPIKRFDFDFAIIFSDILTIPHALGVDVTFIENVGPQINFSGNINSLKKDANFELLQPLFNSIKQVRKNLDAKKKLIGFAGSPFTLACYMLGGRKKDFLDVKQFAISKKQEFEKLLDILTKNVIQLLLKQADAGVDLLMLFDSHAGVLSPSLFEEYVTKPHEKIVKALRQKTSKPIICFPKNALFMLQDFINKIKPDVVGIDYNFPIQKAFEIVPQNIILQGNLDSNILAFGTKEDIQKQVKNILHYSKNRKFIFNLGHGILPQTPINNVHYILEAIRG